MSEQDKAAKAAKRLKRVDVPSGYHRCEGCGQVFTKGGRWCHDCREAGPRQQVAVIEREEAVQPKYGVNSVPLPSPMMVALLSIVVHIEEIAAQGWTHAHPADFASLQTCLQVPEVRDELAIYDSMAMLPVRRDGVRYEKPEGGAPC